MSITVVTTRDHEGAPTTRDVYADAVRYRIGDSNLEVYSAQSQLLAFYGSGNWQSVFVDDPVQVHTGPPDPSAYDGLPLTSDLLPAEVVPRRAPAPRGTPPADAPRTPVAIRRPRPEPRPAGPGDGSAAATEASAPTETAPPVSASAEMLARSPAMRRVRFAPKIFRAARPGATPPAETTTWSRPTSLRPVVFRPKVYRAARGAAEAAASPPDDDED